MLLEVRNLVKRYKLPGAAPICVLDDISFGVAANERVAIVGRSGAGKTTLLNILGGLSKPTSGDVFLDGVSLFSGWGAARRRTRLRAEAIGFVFQSYRLMPELDIVENVALPAMTLAVKNIGNRQSRAIELLKRVGLKHRLNHLPAELSGGEQQRVALARALMCRPKIIFADEPTGNLDNLTGSDILHLLFEVNEEPLAVVMVTHSESAAALCDRRLLLNQGKIVSES